jgi:hypothetical protein
VNARSAARRWARILVAGAAIAACTNAGADRVLTVTGVAQVRGLIYFDRDGDQTFSIGDSAAKGVKVQLIAAGTADTVARATADTLTVFAGSPVNFSFKGVPTGTYRVAVDTLTIPHDSMRVTHIDSLVTLGNGDTAFVRISVAFPQVTIAAARALPVRTKVWVRGIALANANAWGDSTNSFADLTGPAAIRITRINPTAFVFVGDTDRVLGTTDTLSGQPILRFSSLSQIGQPGGAAPTSALTVGQAKTANGGAADAALISVSLRVVILDTLSGPRGRILHVKDTTASLADTLEVHLDTAAQFDSAHVTRDTINARVHLSGILFPSTVPGRWMLKPRSPADQSP